MQLPPALSEHLPTPHVIHLPPFRDLLRRTAENVLEATVVPMMLFYLFLTMIGLRWALVAALGWAYAAIIRRLIGRQRVPGLLVMAAVLFTARTVIALVTGSTFIYFLQPTLGTFLVSALFLISVPMGRPLAERLAHDFCALPESLIANVHVKKFFLRISLLWAFTYMVNGAMALYLLTSSSLGTYLVMRQVVSFTLLVSAITFSSLYFFRSLRHEGIVLRWHKKAGPADGVPVAA
ncbi:MAG: hypothetical protein QOG53_3426 [Frankiales bacterium]|jgi:hypothetical protein|nr:hypothetical protein [Frankiales bacterium]